MILLDTNVMSEVRHPRGAAAVKAWMSALDRDTTFISVVSVAEIAKGVHRLSPGPRRSELADWLHETKLIFADRILPVDADAAEFCGERQGMAMSKGLTVSFPDGLIAATARTKGLRVATRNVADLIAAGASVYDPWTGSMHEPAP
jgi:predicted nucleic acid-binding protein